MRTLRILICISLFVLSKSAVFSQSNETLIISLEEITESNDNVAKKNEIKRDIELLSVLPVVTYNQEIDEIRIMSNFVYFDNVTYEICDADGLTVTYGTVSLPKNEEVCISTSTLPNGMGYIYIVIGEGIFVGEFRKE